MYAAGEALGIPATPSGSVPRLAAGVGCRQAGLRGRNGSPAAAVPGLNMRKGVAEPGMGAVEAIDALRGGGLPKKLGGKNVGLLIILLSLLYLPRAMAQCESRLMPQRGSAKPVIQRLGCGPGLSITNMATLSGLAMVLVNSRNYDRCLHPPPEPARSAPSLPVLETHDSVLMPPVSLSRHGRSKLKMRLTGAVIMGLGMLLIIAHAGKLRPIESTPTPTWRYLHRARHATFPSLVHASSSTQQINK